MKGMYAGAVMVDNGQFGDFYAGVNFCLVIYEH